MYFPLITVPSSSVIHETIHICMHVNMCIGKCGGEMAMIRFSEILSSLD